MMQRILKCVKLFYVYSIAINALVCDIGGHRLGVLRCSSSDRNGQSRRLSLANKDGKYQFIHREHFVIVSP